MSDLISRSALIKALEQDKASICSHVYALVNPCDADDLEFELEYLIYCQQTVEARPCGEWLEKEMYYQCSHCKTGFNSDIKWIANGLPKFCPECGADMRKKVQE